MSEGRAIYEFQVARLRLRIWLCNGRVCLCCGRVDNQKLVGVVDETFAAHGLDEADVLGGDTSIGLWNMKHPKKAVQKNDLIVSVDARNKEGQTDCGHMLLKIRKPVLRTVILFI